MINMMKVIFISTLSFAGSMYASASNLLTNGDFSNGLQHWTSNRESSVNADYQYQSDVVVPGQVWESNLSYPVMLEIGVEYKLTFKAKSSVPREIVAGWGMNNAPWSADVMGFALNSEWQTFEFIGFVSYVDAAASRIIFDYGHQAGTVYIDDVVLEPVEGFADTNLISNGDFSNGLGSWSTNQFPVIDEEGAFVSDVTWTGNPWDWSVSQPVSLKGNTRYRLSFKAKASEIRDLRVGWGKNGGDWAADMRPVLLGAEWRTYTVEGEASFGEYVNSRIIFDYGHQFGAVYIDDVVFEELAPETLFVTEDAAYTLGQHINELGEDVLTEVFYDVGAGYLTPKSFAPHGAGWIIDNPQASTVDGDILRSTVVFKGLYVEDCFTGQWINVLNTEYAYNIDPLVVIPSLNLYTLNHYYVKTVAVKEAPLTYLNERFLCDQPNDEAEYDVVALPGVDEDHDGVNDDQIILIEGSAKFAYVVEHR
ncbi:Endoglucanase C [Thalassocella blandensis]|nr:Endoglucanase C [Thalassocella blandensis]